VTTSARRDGRGGRPPNTGRPCLAQPCPHAGGNLSGLCRDHYRALWRRTQRFRRLVGTDLALVSVRASVERLTAHDAVAAESLVAIRNLLDGLWRGTLLVVRNGQHVTDAESWDATASPFMLEGNR
jgi:hypothetical protein